MKKRSTTAKSKINTSLHGLKITQKRGHLTYEALVEAGFRLLVEKDLDEITIAQLAKQAGYSVGAFYARFRSKDEFFEALVSTHLERRSQTLNRLYEKLPIQELAPAIIKNIINYYWKNRRFWRAAQMRNIRDAGFAKRFRKNFSNRSDKFITYVEQELQRSLTKTEEADINFAFQLVMGTINNAAFNESGPILLGQKLFVKEMQRSFNLVSGIENLLGISSSTAK